MVHITYISTKKQNGSLPVPNHRGDIPKGTLNNILKQAGLKQARACNKWREIMKVIYPVLFYEEKEGEYSVFVPDLENELNINASTCGDSLENAMEMAEDLIAGIVLDGMEDGNKIPKASKIQDIKPHYT